MSEKLYFGVLTVEDIWLRQNAPEFLERMKSRYNEELARSGNGDEISRWISAQAQKDAAWDAHKHEIPRLRHWNEPHEVSTPLPDQKLKQEL